MILSERRGAARIRTWYGYSQCSEEEEHVRLVHYFFLEEGMIFDGYERVFSVKE